MHPRPDEESLYKFVTASNRGEETLKLIADGSQLIIVLENLTKRGGDITSYWASHKEVQILRDVLNQWLESTDAPTGG